MKIPHNISPLFVIELIFDLNNFMLLEICVRVQFVLSMVSKITVLLVRMKVTLFVALLLHAYLSCDLFVLMRTYQLYLIIT